MNRKEIVKKTAEYIKEKFLGEGSGHDWWHIYRVWKNAVHICEEEGGDMFVVELGALLHDIADFKFHDGDETIGPRKAREWLQSLDVDTEVVKKVEHIVKEISFKGVKVDSKMNLKEGYIVQDADRLDAIGAVGIARVFAFGGNAKREIHDPEIKFELHEDSEEYKKNKSTGINHFYEKLLLLKNLMNTRTGKKIAQERHEFMELYLKEFFLEWEGEK